jgi:hypothetical protein
MGLKITASRAPLDDITSVPNVMKIYQAAQKLLVGDTHRYTQTDRLVIDKLTYIFGN